MMALLAKGMEVCFQPFVFEKTKTRWPESEHDINIVVRRDIE
jgi:hypothetical protein